MKLSVVLVGLDRSGAFGEAQDAEELEALLSHSLRKVCPVFAAERVESRACFAALAEVTHAAGGLEVVFFVIAVFVCPMSYIVGVLGYIVVLLRSGQWGDTQ